MPTVYLETTIPSYLAAHPSRDLIVAAHQQITHEWWREARQRFDVYISEAVLAEFAPVTLMQQHVAWPSWRASLSWR